MFPEETKRVAIFRRNHLFLLGSPGQARTADLVINSHYFDNCNVLFLLILCLFMTQLLTQYIKFDTLKSTAHPIVNK